MDRTVSQRDYDRALERIEAIARVRRLSDAERVQLETLLWLSTRRADVSDVRLRA